MASSLLFPPSLGVHCLFFAINSYFCCNQLPESRGLMKSPHSIGASISSF